MLEGHRCVPFEELKFKGQRIAIRVHRSGKQFRRPGLSRLNLQHITQRVDHQQTRARILWLGNHRNDGEPGLALINAIGCHTGHAVICRFGCRKPNTPASPCGKQIPTRNVPRNLNLFIGLLLVPDLRTQGNGLADKGNVAGRRNLANRCRVDGRGLIHQNSKEKDGPPPLFFATTRTS